MRTPRLILLSFLFLLPFMAFAQSGVITGKVTRAADKSPVPVANVFLSNTTAGAVTNANGDYTLANLKPGQYQLVVSIIGYQDYSQNVLVGSEPIKINIELQPKINQMREVTITTNANWKKNYAQFVRDFIGTDENAKDCVVINPHVVNLAYHRKTQTLEAYTEDFLVVENLALGYQIKFLVDTFASDGISHIISYSGKRLFSELKGSKRQQEDWHKKREEAYYGSAMHFYRSLYQDKLQDEGFQMLKFTRSLNPNRPQEEEIMEKRKYFTDHPQRDSLNHWIDLENMSKYYREFLDRVPMPPNSILYRTDQTGVYAVNFTGYYLYVIYTKKREEVDFKDIYRPLDMDNFETTVITLYRPYLFDMNGVVFGNSAPLYEGTWSKSKLSDLLPVDYTPDQP